MIIIYIFGLSADLLVRRNNWCLTSLRLINPSQNRLRAICPVVLQRSYRSMHKSWSVWVKFRHFLLLFNLVRIDWWKWFLFVYFHLFALELYSRIFRRWSISWHKIFFHRCSSFSSIRLGISCFDMVLLSSFERKFVDLMIATFQFDFW